MDRTIIAERALKLTIDGKDVSAYEGQTIGDVAEDNGIYIPTLCHFPHINPPVASCRVCTVKVNGRLEPACATPVINGMEVEVNPPEVSEYRKAVIEMLFAEGNHFCPACSKSGNCELQRKSYENGIAVSRFPHQFEQKPLDFNGKRIVLEQSRCIHCKRCIERVETNEGERVFSFVNRGRNAMVQIDYDAETKLTNEQAIGAMNLCPVGAIMVKGESCIKPFGLRKYDKDEKFKRVPVDHLNFKLLKNDRKKVIATTSLAGCFGCHMSLLDIDLGILDVFDLVEFNKSPLTDIKKFTKDVDIGIIEGGVANSENYLVLQEFRKKCKVLISIGECALWGGIPAIRNSLPLEDCLRETYLDSVTSKKGERVIPFHEDIPKLLDKVYATNEFVKIDYFIPGCPPNPNIIWKVVKDVINGTETAIEYSEFKYD